MAIQGLKEEASKVFVLGLNLRFQKISDSFFDFIRLDNIKICRKKYKILKKKIKEERLPTFKP